MVLEDTPNHLPDDIWHFIIEDNIKGPIEVMPEGSTQFLVPAYEEIAAYYRHLSALNWRMMDKP